MNNNNHTSNNNSNTGSALLPIHWCGDCIVGTLSYVVVNTLEDLGTALQLAVFFRIALKWSTIGALQLKQHSPIASDAVSSQKRKKCCRTDNLSGSRRNSTLSIILTIVMLMAASVLSYLQSVIGVPVSAPYGTQSGLVNALKLYFFAAVVLVFMFSNVIFGCRVARRLRYVISHRQRTSSSRVSSTTASRRNTSSSLSRSLRGSSASASPVATTTATVIPSSSPTGWQSLSQSSVGSANSATSTGSDDNAGTTGSTMSRPMLSPVGPSADRGPRSPLDVPQKSPLCSYCEDRRLRRMVIYVGLSTLVALVRVFMSCFATSSGRPLLT